MVRSWMAASLASALACAPMANNALAQATPPAQPAVTPAPDAVAAARTALESALAAAPLSLPVALFVKERPAGYGLYEPRDDTRFKPGEPMFIYLEPQGYKYKEAAGYVTFGMTLDFAVLGKDGAILGGKEHFMEVSARSHHRNTEWMLPPSINIQNAPPGDYQLELTLHDASSSDVAHVRLPFTME